MVRQELQLNPTYILAYAPNVVGTDLANKSVVQTIIDTAPDRSKTLAFNYASQALNNSFFLDTLVRYIVFRVFPRAKPRRRNPLQQTPSTTNRISPCHWGLQFVTILALWNN
jgi:hypothetical protein